MTNRAYKKDFGDKGEEFAAQLLKKKGYKVVARKFRSTFGEIDIVAVKGGTLYFVEVKTRWSLKYGNPEEAVTPKKVAKIKRAGEYYCLTHPEMPEKLLILVVAIRMLKGQRIKAKIIPVY
jgi:putative endonuclease